MKLKEYPYDKYGSSQIRVIDDTDCACEGDDPFAIAHILITSKFDVKAVTAANFRHLPESADLSYDAINKLVDVMGLNGQVNVLHGSAPMRSETDYDRSEASDFIVEEALRDDPRPLFVVCQGAITNLAIALQTNPEIAEKIQCIWIGGNVYPEGGEEFNLSNDVYAARVVMNSSMSLWQVPKNVYSMMRISFMSLYENLYPCGKPGRYLVDQLWEFNKSMQDLFKSPIAEQIPIAPKTPESHCMFGTGEAWMLGDSPVVGLMLNCQPCDREIIGAPYINDDSTYTLRPDNPRKIAVYHTIDSQFIFNDFFAKMRYQYGDQD